MNIRAKFRCDKIVRTSWSPPGPNAYESFEVHMSPVSGNDGEYGENTKFHTATPSGSLVMSVDNKLAQPAFEVGQYYYLDFTPALK